MDNDVGQSVLVRLFSTFCSLGLFVPRDVLMVVLWWGRSEGEGLHPVQGDCVFPGPVGQDVYARVPWHCVQVHVSLIWLGSGVVGVGLMCMAPCSGSP